MVNSIYILPVLPHVGYCMLLQRNVFFCIELATYVHVVDTQADLFFQGTSFVSHSSIESIRALKVILKEVFAAQQNFRFDWMHIASYLRSGNSLRTRASFSIRIFVYQCRECFSCYLQLVYLFIGSICKVYTRLPSYRGYDLNCTACQGTLGDPCDVSPQDLPQVVPCRGSCVVWRTLYNTGQSQILRFCMQLFMTEE